MDFREETIRECVKRYEQESGIGEKKYNEFLEKMRELDLESITENDVSEVIKDFLYTWGTMQRVLGQRDNWTSNLAEQIQSNCETLKELNTKDLAEVDLGKFESEIKECYESFKGAVQRTAAAKVLHLICPNFFPPWDTPINAAYRNGVKTNGERNSGIEQFSAADYYRFMQQIQKLLKKYQKVLSDLASQYGKGKLKILDECLWWLTHEPLSLLL